MSNFASGYVKYINHLEQINDAAVSDPARMIDEVEDAYHDHLENIARNITSHHQGVRVVMLSGPSSSGKTTTAHLLRDYLTQYGAKSYIVSLDDFYRGVGLAPRLPDGEYNYESVEALDVEAIKQCLLDIITTGRFSVPSYNFALGRPTGQPRPYQLGEGDIVIVEGMDLRLVRRIVRDVQFRDTTPERTLSMWDQVVEGEDRYIRPYRLSADYTVNSIHIYEPCVMRTVAIPLLRAIAEDSPYYRKARDLEARLMRFEPISASLVPENSMLREFLGPKQPG